MEYLRLAYAFKLFFLFASLIFCLTKLRLKTFFNLSFQVLTCLLLVDQLAALDIQNFCHKLSFGLSEVESLLYELVAIDLVIVAELSKCEVHLLE